MNLSDFFVVIQSYKRGSFIARYTGPCGDPRLVLRGEEMVEMPMQFEHHMGSRMYDWVASSHLFLELISTRIQLVLSQNGSCGWHTIPAVVRHKKLGIVRGYGCLVVTGRAGPVDFSKSHLEKRLPLGPRARPYMVHVGLHVDFSKWDGSDIFTPVPGSFIIVTGQVRDALIKAGTTGVDYIALDRYEAEDDAATALLWREMGLPSV